MVRSSPDACRKRRKRHKLPPRDNRLKLSSKSPLFWNDIGFCFALEPWMELPKLGISELDFSVKPKYHSNLDMQDILGNA